MKRTRGEYVAAARDAAKVFFATVGDRLEVADSEALKRAKRELNMTRYSLAKLVKDLRVEYKPGFNPCADCGLHPLLLRDNPDRKCAVSNCLRKLHCFSFPGHSLHRAEHAPYICHGCNKVFCVSHIFCDDVSDTLRWCASCLKLMGCDAEEAAQK